MWLEVSDDMFWVIAWETSAIASLPQDRCEHFLGEDAAVASVPDEAPKSICSPKFASDHRRASRFRL